MRHNALLGPSLPGRCIGRQLQPGRAEREVVGGRSQLQAVDTVSDTLYEVLLVEEAIERRTRNPRPISLAAGHKPPLVGSDGAEPADRRFSGHYCNLPHK